MVRNQQSFVAMIGVVGAASGPASNGWTLCRRGVRTLTDALGQG
jgi:hypothetical protein